VTKHCLPHLLRSKNAHILTLSPPIDLDPKWLGAHVAYTLSKYNMTMMAMGWAQEFKQDQISSNSLWPVTTIATAAVNNLLGGESLMQRSRTTDIIADAVYYIMQRGPGKLTGRQLLDEVILKEAGVADFDQYAVNPGKGLQKDLFL
jgi:citronellol/citronellal dehydrogenase